MRVIKTNASCQADDLERAKHLAFDPNYYEAFREQVRDESKAVYLSTFTSQPTTATRVQGFVSHWSDLITLAVSEKFYFHEDDLETGLDARAHRIINLVVGSVNTETLPINEPESSLSDLIDRFRKLPGFAFSEQIANRLDYLLTVSREEQPEQAPPAADSLDSFLAFLSKYSGLAYPGVVLTPDGNIRARWRNSPTELFELEFLPDEDVRFVIFSPDPRRRYKTIRVAGLATVDSILEIAEPYQIMGWVRGNQSEVA